jgi:signal recognition particle receptor subunit beta
MTGSWPVSEWPVSRPPARAPSVRQAHSVEFVRRTLERQLDALRRSRTSAMASATPADAATITAALGKPDGGGGALVLGSLPRSAVTLAPVSVAAGELRAVRDFLAPYAR